MSLDRALENAGVKLAQRTGRRSFLGKLGRGFVAVAGGAFAAAALDPSRARAHHICGHLYTTGSCPHPFEPKTRVDSAGYPLHPTYGYPVDDKGNIYKGTNQTRSKTCEEMVPDKYPFTGRPRYGGGWSRCCGKRIRHISDCCSHSNTRINGDSAVKGYCYGSRKVFCIAYRELNVRC
ncbi:MAG: hypothetical protein WD757_07505 [Actinomycetota bacterium]